MDRQHSLGNEEVARLLQRTEGKVQMAIALMLFGGLRAREVAELRHRDVVVGSNGVLINVRRGAKVDSVEAVGLLRDLLAAQRGDPDEPVIGRKPSGTYEMLHRAMRSQGLTMSVHVLRHTCATAMAASI